MTEEVIPQYKGTQWGDVVEYNGELVYVIKRANAKIRAIRKFHRK